MSSDENPDRGKTEQYPIELHSNERAANKKFSVECQGSRRSVSRSLLCSRKTNIIQKLDEEKGSNVSLYRGNQYSHRQYLGLSKDQCGDGLVKDVGSSRLAKEKVSLIDFDDYCGTQFVDNDAEYDQMEEEEGDACNEDPFANQFIHIGIPATGLKDVSRVKRDLYHDRANTKKSVLSGLHRAVSSVRISENRARATSGPPSASLSSAEPQPTRDVAGLSNLRQLTRMLSFRKTKSSNTTTCEAKSEALIDLSPGGNNQQEESSKGSIQKGNSGDCVSADNTALPLKTPFVKQRKDNFERKEEHQTASTNSREPSNRFLIQRHRESTAQKPSFKRQTVHGIGRNLSLNQQEQTTTHQPDVEDIRANTRSGNATNTDRPRPSRVFSPEVLRTGGRVSLSQMGRIMPFTRRMTNDDMKNTRYHQGSDAVTKPSKEVPSDKTKRSSLAKIGRAMSLSRNRSTVKKPGPGSNNKTQSVQTNLGREIELSTAVPPNREDLQNNPMKRTAALPVPPEYTRAPRKDTRLCEESENVKISAETPIDIDEMSRPKLKTIGRMFSLSRNPGSTKGTAVRLSGAQKSEIGDKPKLGTLQRECAATSRYPGLERESRSEAKCDSNAGKFFVVEITSEQVRSNRLMGGFTHIRVPIVTMGEFAGPASRFLWHTDVFTLPHNAVRRECMDLYDILVSMAQSRKGINISTEDINDLEQWWLVARELFKFYFEVERRILFPWVDSAGSHDLEVQTALKKMRGMKEKLEEHLAGVDRVWNEKTFKSQADMFVIVYKAVDNFVPRLLNYFEDQEVLLPALAQSFCKAEERTRIDKDIAALLMGDEVRRNKEAPNHRLILLVRWMNNPKLVRTWTGRYLNSWARNMYPNWYQMFETEHHRIVTAFQSRKNLPLVTHDDRTRGIS